MTTTHHPHLRLVPDDGRDPFPRADTARRGGLTVEEKAREHRLRREAQRYGLSLRRSRTTGKYSFVRIDDRTYAFGGNGRGPRDLEWVERRLSGFRGLDA
jgi:hypothetical protein